jgi:hypothetical protein
VSSNPKVAGPAATKTPKRERKPAPGSWAGGPFVSPPDVPEEGHPEDIAGRKFHRGLNLLGSGN